MVAAWKILEEKYPSVIVNGCGAYTVNLLVKDICKLPEYQKWLDAARDITGFIMGRGSLRKRLEKIQAHLVEDGEMEFARVLIYVAETRWYTHHLCVRRLLDNKKAIVQLVGTSVFDAVDSSKKSVVVGWISDSLFWTTLSAIESDLSPTSKYVEILEADTCCLSDVYRGFVEMTSAYQGRP